MKALPQLIITHWQINCITNKKRHKGHGMRISDMSNKSNKYSFLNKRLGEKKSENERNHESSYSRSR